MTVIKFPMKAHKAAYRFASKHLISRHLRRISRLRRPFHHKFILYSNESRRKSRSCYLKACSPNQGGRLWRLCMEIASRERRKVRWTENFDSRDLRDELLSPHTDCVRPPVPSENFPFMFDLHNSIEISQSYHIVYLFKFSQNPDQNFLPVHPLMCSFCGFRQWHRSFVRNFVV